jgi:poly(U)-specific endoribonuclease
MEFVGRIEPNSEELENVAVAANHLWTLDINRLTPNVEYDIDLQQGKSFHQAGDAASDPLFARVDEAVLNERSTFSTFIALLDNFTASAGQAEVVTAEERREVSTFLHAIMHTPVMQYCHQYCLATGKTTAADPEGFIALLNQLWFELYSRQGGKLDSSGFEHVFVGEIKNNEVTGMHNWIRIYMEEKKHALDYRGYIKPRYRGLPVDSPDDQQQLVTMQFSWRNVLKKVSTSLIGSSPEFEIALYTMIFLTQPEGKTPVQLGPYQAVVTVYKWENRRNHKSYVASAFLEETH